MITIVQEEEEELLEELGYESSPSDSTHRDSLFLRLSFTLSRGSLSLLTSSPLTLPFLGPSPLVSLSFSSLCSSLEIRPRVRGATFELSLGGLSLNDEVDDDSLFPALMRPKGSEVRGGERRVRERERVMIAHRCTSLLSEV